MANKFIGMGRLTNEPEVKYSEKDPAMAICRYTIAVDRKGKDKECDFIHCVAFGKAGEFASKYFHKGKRVYVEGRLQIGSYTNKDGVKIPTADIIIESQEFADGYEKANIPNADSIMDGFTPVADKEELPFQ